MFDRMHMLIVRSSMSETANLSLVLKTIQRLYHISSNEADVRYCGENCASLARGLHWSNGMMSFHPFNTVPLVLTWPSQARGSVLTEAT